MCSHGRGARRIENIVSKYQSNATTRRKLGGSLNTSTRAHTRTSERTNGRPRRRCPCMLHGGSRVGRHQSRQGRRITNPKRKQARQACLCAWDPSAGLVISIISSPAARCAPPARGRSPSLHRSFLPMERPPPHTHIWMRCARVQGPWRKLGPTANARAFRPWSIRQSCTAYAFARPLAPVLWAWGENACLPSPSGARRPMRKQISATPRGNK